MKHADMKYWLIIVLFASAFISFGSTTAIATAETRSGRTTYYVNGPGGDNGDGDDARDGTAVETAFASIQRAADLAKAGDTIEILAGVYREEVRLKTSGTQELPIRFQAYSNDKVVISGGDLVTAWDRASEIGPDVWKATVNWDAGGNAAANTLFVDGELKYEASHFGENDLLEPDDWGKIPHRTSQLKSHGRSFVSPDLKGFPDGHWDGARIIVQHLDYSFATKTIAQYDGKAGRVTFDSPIAAVNMKQDNLFRIVGTIKALDKPGEWFKQGDQLYYRAGTGQDVNRLQVEFKRRAFGFDFRGQQHVQVDGLSFRGVSIGTDDKSKFHVYSGNVFYAFDKHKFGRFEVADNAIIRDNEFYQVWQSVLNFSDSVRCDVVNNYFHDIGLEPTCRVMNAAGSNKMLFSHNTVRRIARSVFDGYPLRSVFSYNLFEDAGRLSYDTGIFDSDGTNGNSSGSIFHHNVFRKNRARGIFETFYGANDNTVIHHNIVYDWNPNSPRTVFNAYGRYFRQVYHNTFIGKAPNGRGGFVPAEGYVQARYLNNVQSSSDRVEVLGVKNLGNHDYKASDFANLKKGDLRLSRRSRAIDCGVQIPGINDAFSGEAPDAGALESGQAMWKAGHDFENPPSPKYDWRPLVGTNIDDNGLFSKGLTGWDTLAGNPEARDFNSWNLADRSFTGTFRTKSVRLVPGDAIAKTFEGLKPNTEYTVGAAVRVIQLATEAIRFDDSAGKVATGEIRGVPFVTGLGDDASWVEYRNVDFGDADQFDTLEVLIGRADTSQSIEGASVEVRIDKPNGELICKANPLVDIGDGKFYSFRSSLKNLSGSHSVFVKVRGRRSRHVGVGDIRLLRTEVARQDRLLAGVRTRTGLAFADRIGWSDWKKGYESFVFKTDPGETLVQVAFRNDGRVAAYLDRFYLVEGSVRKGDNLVYLTGATSQSSTAERRAAEYAADENISTFSETRDEADSWWQVRFGSKISFGEIRIYGRRDGRADELGNFTVSIWDGGPDEGGKRLWYKSIKSDIGLAGGEPLVITGGDVSKDRVTRLATAFGNILRVQLDGKNPKGNGRLSLADVLVHASHVAKPVANLALSGEATQSSIYYGSHGWAEDAINGITDSLTDFTSTRREANPWWQVKLQKPSKIDQIAIVNRLDSANRLNNFRVSVWDDDPDSGGKVLWWNDYRFDADAGSVSRKAIGPGGILRIDSRTVGGNGVRLNKVRRGRIVRVQLNGQNILSLCEVQVWADG